MTYAHITEFDFGDDRNTVNYDALGARLFDLGQPGGAIHHSSGFDANGVFRIYEVWESHEHRARFVQETLEALLAEGPADPTHPYRPDREYGMSCIRFFSRRRSAHRPARASFASHHPAAAFGRGGVKRSGARVELTYAWVTRAYRF